MSRARAVAATLALALAFVLGGCVRVRPHQRETLAHPAMQASPWQQLERGTVHAFEVREGTGGGGGTAGGGCGCN